MSSRPPVDIDAIVDELLALNWGSKSSPPMEAMSVLFPKGGRTYDIQARTTEGLKWFRDAVADEGHDAQSELGEWDVPASSWDDPLPGEQDFLSDPLPQAYTPESLLAELSVARAADRRRLIIEAEVMRFEGSQRQRIRELLHNYIEENRDSTDREDLIAVAAAIRKVVAQLDPSDMGWLATLLDAGHRAQPSLDTEIEVAKMVYRKYAANPPIEANPQPQLAARLAEMVDAYTSLRIFSRDGYSTAVMLATQAVLVMRSDHSEAVIAKINDLPYPWFRRQLRRRMDRTVEEMRPGVPGRDQLQELVDRIEPN